MKRVVFHDHADGFHLFSLLSWRFARLGRNEMAVYSI
ncbi:hypothetical protein I656_02323 [Geobacillus sp. WSUCF1]|nr:hypothetical protein I656_02323 [Geobacillus sp. WSUCF1]